MAVQSLFCCLFFPSRLCINLSAVTLREHISEDVLPHSHGTMADAWTIGEGGIHETERRECSRWQQSVCRLRGQGENQMHTEGQEQRMIVRSRFSFSVCPACNACTDVRFSPFLCHVLVCACALVRMARVSIILQGRAAANVFSSWE